MHNATLFLYNPVQLYEPCFKIHLYSLSLHLRFLICTNTVATNSDSGGMPISRLLSCADSSCGLPSCPRPFHCELAWPLRTILSSPRWPRPLTLLLLPTKDHVHPFFFSWKMLGQWLPVSSHVHALLNQIL